MARTKKHAPEVAGSVADVPVGAVSASTRPQAPEASDKRRRGAPRGNVNAAKNPKFTLAMREAQRAARRGRRRRLAGHAADARRTVAECGMADSPLGARIAARLAAVEHEIAELAIIVERVGRVKRDGTLNPAYERRLNLIGQDRAELRSLVDKLAEIMAARPREPQGDVIYRAVFDDGTSVHEDARQLLRDKLLRDVDAPFAPLAFDPMAPEALALPAPDDAPAVNVARSGALLPAHPGDVREPKPATLPKPSVTLDVSPLERNWAAGLSPDGYDD